jgi:hypothetical protein
MKSIVNFVPLFEQYNNETLIIVDVQEPFSKWWNNAGHETLPNDINDYCKNFHKVYQIWDDHDAKSPSWKFNNEVAVLRKHYGVDQPDGEIQDYSAYFEGDELKNVMDTINSGVLEPAIFKRKEGNYAILVCGSHKWFLATKELVETLLLINDDIILVGGAEGECLKDIEVLLKLIGKTFSVNYEYTYAANETKKNTVKESNS